MDTCTRVVIEMVRIGEEDDEASFRLRNAPGGQMQRRHILQQEVSSLALQAELISVVHGTMSRGGPAASILLIDFRFLGSRCEGRRFRHAIIDVGFAHGDDIIGSSPFDPEVVNIVPFGVLARNQSSQQITTTFGLYGALIPTPGLNVAGLSQTWERANTTQKTECTMVHGMKRRIEQRVNGIQTVNGARWELTENDNDRHGVPATLRAAILLNPKSSDHFRAIITVEVRTNSLFKVNLAIRRFRGREIVDPVYFDREENREPLNPELLGEVDIENLGQFNLEGINSVGPQEYADLEPGFC